MIVEYIRYKIPRERQREFEEAYANASRSLDASEHCQMYMSLHIVQRARALHFKDRMGLT